MHEVYASRAQFAAKLLLLSKECLVTTARPAEEAGLRKQCYQKRSRGAEANKQHSTTNPFSRVRSKNRVQGPLQQPDPSLHIRLQSDSCLPPQRETNYC